MVRASVSGLIVLLSLGEVGRGHASTRSTIASLVDGIRFRWPWWPLNKVEAPETGRGSMTMPLGCTAGSSFRIESSVYEKANGCYRFATRNDFSEAYSTSGMALSVKEKTGWGQAYVMSFNTYAIDAEHAPSSQEARAPDEMPDDSDHETDAQSPAGHTGKVGMRFWMATFVSPLTEGVGELNLEYQCYSSKLPEDAHPADAPSWSCLLQGEGNLMDSEAVEIDPSDFSLHCGCDGSA